MNTASSRMFWGVALHVWLPMIISILLVIFSALIVRFSWDEAHEKPLQILLSLFATLLIAYQVGYPIFLETAC